MNVSKIKLYLQGFIVFFVLFFLINRLFEPMPENLGLDIFRSALNGLIFSILIIQSHLIKSAEKGCPYYDKENASPFQEHTMECDYSLSEIKGVFKDSDKFENIQMNEEEQRIKMRYSSIFPLRKDKIAIQKADNNKIRISSRPPYSFEFLDNGRNIGHIKHIADTLTIEKQ